jgi:glycosyltransferase involved in cell wall biosynthesis
MKRVVVLGAQVPFTRGGAEIHVESLVEQINRLQDFEAELVQIPFKWYPEEQMLSDVMAWRLLDLSEANGKKIDMVIASKFPTYALQHENKILWLIHQHRTLYDLENTEYDSWNIGPENHLIRDKLRSLDNLFFSECKCIFTNGRTTANRLLHYNGVKGTPLFPPPVHAERKIQEEYGDKILYFGRLEPNKRPDLLIHATYLCESAKTLIVGRGRDEDHLRLQDLIDSYGIANRCQLLGYVTDDTLLKILSEARAVFYAPVDEDYGYATIEAFLALKPVITCTDSGEVRMFVEDTGSGWVAAVKPKEIAEICNWVYHLSEKEIKEIAFPGFEFAQSITWDKVLKSLVFNNL